MASVNFFFFFFDLLLSTGACAIVKWDEWEARTSGGVYGGTPTAILQSRIFLNLRANRISVRAPKSYIIPCRRLNIMRYNQNHHRFVCTTAVDVCLMKFSFQKIELWMAISRYLPLLPAVCVFVCSVLKYKCHRCRGNRTILCQLVRSKCKT